MRAVISDPSKKVANRQEVKKKSVNNTRMFEGHPMVLVHIVDPQCGYNNWYKGIYMGTVGDLHHVSFALTAGNNMARKYLIDINLFRADQIKLCQ